VRALVDDDPVQSATARDILRQPCIITVTALLETEWVLRSNYRWPRRKIAAVLTDVIDLPNAAIVPPAMRWAIQRYADGADFADMAHIALSDGAATFATFDRALAKQAGRETPVPIETLR
jgi:predicted nucleic-acid-binding protein